MLLVLQPKADKFVIQRGGEFEKPQFCHLFIASLHSQITIAKKGADPQLKTLEVPTHDEDLRVRQMRAELESQKKEEVERAMKVDRDRIELLENLRQKQERDKIERQEPKGRSLSFLGAQEDAVRFRPFTVVLRVSTMPHAE